TVLALDEQRRGVVTIPGAAWTRPGVVDGRHRGDTNPVVRLEMRFERRVLEGTGGSLRRLALLQRGARLGVSLSGLACLLAHCTLETALLGHSKPPRRAPVPQRRGTRTGLYGKDLEGRFPFALGGPGWGRILTGSASARRRGSNGVIAVRAVSTTQRCFG